MGKNHLLHCFVVLAALAASISALAQGGSAGGFQGNQGGRGGQLENSYPPNNLAADPGIWDSKSMILTQGDKVEWKIKAVPGQTIFATVRSEVFDPAIKLLDSKNKVIAENDDQYDGNQAPFLVYQFKDDKEYKLTVQNYRSSAGGRFVLYTHTFMPVDIAPGVNSKPVKVNGLDGEPAPRTYLHFKAEEGKIYSIPEVVVRQGNRMERLGFQMIIGPTGVHKDDYYSYRPHGGEPLFEAKKAGDYYLVYRPAGLDGELTARLDTIELQKVEKVGALKVDLIPLGQKIVKFTVERGDVIHQITENGDGIGFETEYTSNEDEKEKDRSLHRGDANGSPRVFEPKYENHRDFYTLYTQKCEVTMVVRNFENRTTSVTLNRNADVQAWEDGRPAMGKIGLGETQYFMISGKKGDIQRLKGSADGFELVFSLIDMNGDARGFVDKRSHQPGTEMRYEDNAKYLVAVTSPEGGGSGSFSMTLNNAKPEAITLNSVVTYTEGPSFGTYSLEVEKGVRYQLLSSRTDVPYTLIDDAGNVIGSSSQNFGGQNAVYFVPSKNGAIKIKINGPAGTKFRVDKLVLPDLGG